MFTNYFEVNALQTFQCSCHIVGTVEYWNIIVSNESRKYLSAKCKSKAISLGNTSNQTRSDMVFQKEIPTSKQPFLATKAINPKIINPKIKIHS